MSISSPLILSKTQKCTLRTLQDLINNRLETHDEFTRTNESFLLSKPTYDHNETEDSSNIFAILGPRGSGKSTILRNLFKATTSNDYCQLLFSTYTLNCSTIPDSLHPGIALTINIIDSLKKPAYTLNKHASQLDSKKVSELERQGKELLDAYVSLTHLSQQLGLDLSSSSLDFTSYITNGMQKRLHLKQDLSNWIDSILNLVNRKLLVVFLDDFDLVDQSRIQEWLFTLMAELKQPKILFILTADFNRLQHLSWGKESNIDENTGQAILRKLIPPQNRATLDEWDKTTIFSYPFENKEKMTDIILKFATGYDGIIPLIFQLLPKWPRGIASLTKALSEDNKPTTFQELLQLLATVRGESQLSRRLKDQPFYDWPDALKLPNNYLSSEEWNELVHTVIERNNAYIILREYYTTKNPNKLDKLHFLPLKSIVHNPYIKAKTDHHKDDSELFAETYTLRQNNYLENPLFHTEHRFNPLGDALNDDLACWTELLFSLSISNINSNAFPLSEHIVSSAMLLRNRMKLYDWQPFQKQLETTRFLIPFHNENLYRFFDRVPQPSRASLAWFSWDDERIEIGWQPLISALRLRRKSFSAAKLQDLMINPNLIKGDDLEPELFDALKLIPHRIWALVVLVDALNRCPWEYFSRDLNWELRSYIVISAAFVQSAYAFALRQVKILAPEVFSPHQNVFLEALEQRDPRKLCSSDQKFDMTSQSGLFQLAKLALEHSYLPELKSGNALQEAASNYLNSRAHRAALALAGL